MHPAVTKKPYWISRRHFYSVRVLLRTLNCITSYDLLKDFCVHGSVHRESMSIIVQQDATIYTLL
jgi:hypothetical protein